LGYNNKQIRITRMPHHNNRITDIIKQFDRQIQKEYNNYNGKKELCPSYWNKLIFLETLHFNINDWRKIRDNDYYINADFLKGIEKSKFIYQIVKHYNKL